MSLLTVRKYPSGEWSEDNTPTHPTAKLRTYRCIVWQDLADIVAQHYGIEKDQVFQFLMNGDGIEIGFAEND